MQEILMHIIAFPGFLSSNIGDAGLHLGCQITGALDHGGKSNWYRSGDDELMRSGHGGKDAQGD
jgi:hypothetical protein